jgi:hypothetical protein
VLVGVLTAGALSPVWACGPFLYDNADLDRFSFLDPGILNNHEWTNFLAYASPPLGQPSIEGAQSFSQMVIRPERLAETSQGTVNALYETSPGEDAPLVQANEAWWSDYFERVRHRALSPEVLQTVLYGPDRPGWLAAADLKYLKLLDGDPQDPQSYDTALTEARNRKNPVGLRHRFAFFAVRFLALSLDPLTVTVFREFCPGAADDLPLARAQGWAASVMAQTDPVAARDLWVDLLVRWPDLRVQTFSSLSTLPAEVWTGSTSAGALVARYFLDGRDFSPETLGALAMAEKAAGGEGWTEAVFYSMAEQIEGEAGVFALFGLADPREVSPRGLFTDLIDRAVTLADRGMVKATRTWWLVASYLCLFDGDPARATALLSRARSAPALNSDQEHQTALVAALVQMDVEKDKDWSVGLQNQVVDALDWGRALDAPGHNRGLYHSVAVLVAQKELARGRLTQAALAFGLVQSGTWGNLYRVNGQDWFWSTMYTSNNPVNLMLDALMTDGDLDLWDDLLTSVHRSPASLAPLTARLASSSFLTARDLVWWKAHRALRRGQGETALALLKTLGPPPATPSQVFPGREFSYSLDLDPLDPRSGRGLRTVSPLTLAGVMTRIEATARTQPTSQVLLDQGEFWFSLQLSGLPLLFAQPPRVIGFVNDNYEYYGYNTGDQERDTAVVGNFPLGRPGQTDPWAQRLRTFYRDEFSTLGRAREAFSAVIARHDDPEAEYRALLFLQALGGHEYTPLADARYDALPLAQTFRTTCELFQRGWL